MLAGARAWLERGLDPPERVRVATTEYLVSADAFGRWLEECCVTGGTLYMTKAAAFESWKTWAEAACEYVGTTRQLGDRLSRVPAWMTGGSARTVIRPGSGSGSVPPADPADRADRAPIYSVRARARNAVNASLGPFGPQAVPSPLRGRCAVGHPERAMSRTLVEKVSRRRPGTGPR